MKIHEYQAVDLFRAYGIPCPAGIVAETADEVYAAASKIGTPVMVLKAQVHSGGRGKAGGVKLVHNADEARLAAKEMIGKRLMTKQAGPEGKLVRKVLLSEGISIEKEYYLSMTIDSANECIAVIASQAGGTEIEEIAVSAPEKIIRQSISIDTGIRNYHCIALQDALGLNGDAGKQLNAILKGMYRLLVEKDCSLVEINPLVMTADGKLMASDAKVNFDDNALFRHQEIAALRDTGEEDVREVEASKYDLNYVQLDGNIGCMINGAGLAMATMDIIKAYGGEPANFLDVGGGATEEKVSGAFSILLSDSNVKGILINIFGGIMKCDIIAAGVVSAARKLNVNIPIVVRLEGTNAEQGKKVLSDSGLSIIPAKDMADGAKKICELVLGKEATV